MRLKNRFFGRILCKLGEMVEWFKAAVLKTAVAQVTEGSNPSFSANIEFMEEQVVEYGNRLLFFQAGDGLGDRWPPESHECAQSRNQRFPTWIECRKISFPGTPVERNNGRNQKIIFKREASRVFCNSHDDRVIERYIEIFSGIFMNIHPRKNGFYSIFSPPALAVRRV